MTTSRHFLSPVGAAGLATTRRFSPAKRLESVIYLSATERPGGHSRSTIPPMPDSMTKMAIRMHADGSGSPGRPSTHRLGPRYRVGSVARANRSKERSADCKISRCCSSSR